VDINFDVYPALQTLQLRADRPPEPILTEVDLRATRKGGIAMDQRDIVEQLQDACELQTDKRELERLCGNARSEIMNLRALCASQADKVRELKGVPSSELRLELHLRAGPHFQCMSPECRSYEDGPGKWDTCPSCGRKGYLCGSFKLDKESAEFKQWEARTVAKYRSSAAARTEGGS